jgi:hypothetical protein
MPLQRILVVTRYGSFIMYLRKMTCQDNIGPLPSGFENIQPGNNTVILPAPGHTMCAPRRSPQHQEGQQQSICILYGLHSIYQI